MRINVYEHEISQTAMVVESEGNFGVRFFLDAVFRHQQHKLDDAVSDITFWGLKKTIIALETAIEAIQRHTLFQESHENK
jgi:hypothetical protein